MPSKTLKSVYDGIRVLELKRSLWHGKPDRVYFARITIGGVRREIRLGKDSEGWDAGMAAERRRQMVEDLLAGRVRPDGFSRVGKGADGRGEEVGGEVKAALATLNKQEERFDVK